MRQTPSRRAPGLRWSSLLALALAACWAGPAAAQDRRGWTTPGLVLETGARTATCDALTFTADGSELLAAGEDKVVRAWPLGADTIRREAARVLRWPTYREQQGSIFALALSPDGRQVAVGGHGVYPGMLMVLDRRTGAVRHVLLEPLTTEVTWAIAWSPDARYVVFGTEGGQLFRWEPGQKRPVRFAASPAGSHNRVRLLAFLDGRRFLAVTRDGQALEFDAEAPAKAGRRVARLSKDLIAAALSPDGRWLAVCGENVTGEKGLREHEVELLDLRKLRAEGGAAAGSRRRIPVPQGRSAWRRPGALAFDADSKRLAVGTRDSNHLPEGARDFARVTGGRVYVWSLAGAEPALLSEKGLDVGYRVERIAFRPGKPGQLATAGGRNHEVRLWDYRKEGAALATVRSPGSCLWAVAMSSNGKYLGWKERLNPNPGDPNDRGAGPWRVFTLDRKARRILPAPPRDFTPVRPLTECDGWRVEPTASGFVWRVVGPGGTRAELSDRAGLYFSAVNQVPRCYTFIRPRLEKQPVRLAVGHQWGVSLYELRPREVRLARVMHGHEGEVTAVAPSADGTLLLTASRDQTIACWSLEHWPGQRELGASFVPERGQVVVRDVTPGSPAWELGLTDGDEVVMVVSRDRYGRTNFVYDPEKKGIYDPKYRGPNRYWFPMPQAPRFIDAKTLRENLANAEPLRQYIFLWRHDGKVSKQLTTVRQRPLWRFFPTRAEEGGDWIIWRWRDFFYDTTSPRADRLVGWQVNPEINPAGKPDLLKQPPAFYPLSRFSGAGEDAGKKEARGFYVPDKVWKFLTLRDKDPRKIHFADIEPPEVALRVVQQPVKDPKNPKNDRPLIVRVSARPRAKTPGQKLTRVTLWLSDTRHDRPLAADPKTGVLDARVEIPTEKLRRGPTEVTLSCFNEAGGRSEASELVFFADPTRPRSNLYALCVGMKKYGGVQNLKLNDLNFPENDARALAEVFRQQRASALFADSEVEQLLGPQATVKTIRRHLEAFRKKVRPDDWLVLFLSGHGYGEPTDDAYKPYVFYYICSDSDYKKPATMLGISDLKELAETIPCRKLIILDACRSGGLLSDPIHSFNKDGPRFLVFASCRPDQDSVEPDPAKVGQVPKLKKLNLQHGVFTEGLLAALGHPSAFNPRKGRQRPVTALEMVDAIELKVREMLTLLGEGPTAQTPVFEPDRPRLRALGRLELFCKP
jgi:WD40 repeat protein